MEYARKDYYNNIIAKDNQTFEVNRDEEIKKFILYREKEITWKERVNMHLEKLLDQTEKKIYNFDAPK